MGNGGIDFQTCPPIVAGSALPEYYKICQIWVIFWVLRTGRPNFRSPPWPAPRGNLSAIGHCERRAAIPSPSVIASAARQSLRYLSLRAPRGNLSAIGHCERRAAIFPPSVIASAARQSLRYLSLRAQRGNPVAAGSVAI